MAGVVSLLLCEFATTHKDGTCTIVRGGIDTWASALPVDLPLHLLVQIDANALSVGARDASVEVLNPQGLSVRKTAIVLTVLRAEFPARFTLPIGVSIQSYGQWIIRVEIAGLSRADLALVVKDVETQS